MEIRSFCYGAEKAVKSILVLAGVIVLLTAGVIIFRDKLIILENMIATLPTDFYPFLGMKAMHQMDVVEEVLAILMNVMNVIILIIIAIGSAKVYQDVIDYDEYCYFMGQPHGRIYFLLMRLLAVFTYGLFLWCGYILLFSTAFFTVDQFTPKNASLLQLLGTCGVNGLFLVLFMEAFGILYVILAKTYWGFGNLVICVATFGFLLGNAYKVPNLIFYYMRERQVDARIVINIGSFLKKFVWTHPLEQLNLFVVGGKTSQMGILRLYGLVGLLILMLSCALEMTREYKE